MLAVGIVQAFSFIYSYMSMQQEPLFANLLSILFSSLMPAGYLFFGASLIERADRILERLRS